MKKCKRFSTLEMKLQVLPYIICTEVQNLRKAKSRYKIINMKTMWNICLYNVGKSKMHII